MDKEKQILHYIKLNPYISQQELSEKIGISRSTIANYVAGLIQKGEIKGRAYILKEKSSITCIGGANIDRKEMAKQSIHLRTSNPVQVTESCGGVARNVAENLAKLNCQVSLISCVGTDKEGYWLMQETKNCGIDVSQMWLLDTERTGTYTALLDVDGELIVSMADMNLYEKITPGMVEKKRPVIKASQAVFLDTNFSEQCLAAIIKNCKEDHIPLYVDPISIAKAKKLPQCLDGVKMILPNREEAEILAGTEIHSLDDCPAVSDKIRRRGAETVVITLGQSGIFYSSEKESGHLPALKTDIVDVTGAGDAFAAGVIYAIGNGDPLDKACQLGLTAASLTVQTKDTVSKLLNADKIYERLKEHS